MYRHSSRRISLFDTTLRDGEQAPGNSMTPSQKLDLAFGLEAIGVDVIETGFPSSSPSDFEATRLISEAVTTARISTLNRAHPADIDASVKAGGLMRHHLQILATGSETHLEHKRGISQAEAEREVIDTITYAKSLGMEYVSVGVEDATRGSDSLLEPLIKQSTAAGADTVVVCDTTGCTTPEEFASLIRKVKMWGGPSVTVSTHCHEDMGLSLANALAGIQAGADEVQGTLAGIGERAGNTSLEELIGVLYYKGAELGCVTATKPNRIQPVFEKLCDIIGIRPPWNKAILGKNAFATQAGIHQAGMLRNPVTYEFVQPEVFGRERSILVGRHSGRAIIRHAFEQLHLPIDEETVERIYQDKVVNSTGGECVDLKELSEFIRETGVLAQ